ncbi:hypothetical protein KKD52_15455 [Myxococcota bacterium]|nr:hypothetical protein [Myxococcota bacterium]MBU1411852.1 hypothetical protein [Myxococcota bacterium]MBU1511748.1 hypothetical protein [Myxococcota bacterium]
MKIRRTYTALEKRLLGKRYSSRAIAAQVGDARLLWRLFLAQLTEFGHGPDELGAFEAEADAHQALMGGRADGVAQKTLTLAERDALIHDGWVWVQKVVATLSIPARTDADCATRLNAAMPVEDLDLGTAIDALAGILKDKMAGLSPAIPAQARLDEAPALRQSLAGIFSTAKDAKQLPVVDTAELDERDGELYLRMRDLYEAGRAAIRAGLIDRPLANFRFTHLRHGRTRANDPAVDPTPAQ